MNLRSKLGQLRLIAWLEGWSLILLLFLAMPFKYLLDMPLLVRYIGMAHGLLFVVYVLWVIMVGIEQGWKIRLFLLAFLASILPFGTFYADKHWFIEKN